MADLFPAMKGTPLPWPYGLHPHSSFRSSKDADESGSSASGSPGMRTREEVEALLQRQADDSDARATASESAEALAERSRATTSLRPALAAIHSAEMPVFVLWCTYACTGGAG